MQISSVNLGSDNTTIEFETLLNLNLKDMLSVTVNNEEHYFVVKNIKAQDDHAITVKAVEEGYSSNYLNRESNIDIRALIGLRINKIEDEETIKRIKKESRWC